MQRMLNPKNPKEIIDVGEVIVDTVSAFKKFFGRKKVQTENLDPCYSYIGDIVVNDTIAFDSNRFSRIYDQIPRGLCDSYIDALDCFRRNVPNYGGGGASSITYEEILKLYIDLSADVSILGTADTVIGLIKLFTDIGIPIPSIQTVGLSFIWASMICDLEEKRSSRPYDSEKERIAKMCIGLLGFVSQVFHRETPLWKWLGSVYKGFAMAGDYVKRCPYLYRKVFPGKYIDINLFPNWHKELEKHIGRDDMVTIGQAFNICYTFRVGDIYLHSVLSGSTYFDEELRKRLVDALSPVPVENDLLRLFDLYTETHIY